MGEALAVGLIDGGWDAATLAIAEVDPDRRHLLEAACPGSGSSRARRGPSPTPTSSSSR